MKAVQLIIFFTLIQLLPVPVLSFDEKKCAKIIGAGEGLGLLASTSSYISSTSDCSAVGLVENKKKFIAFNSNELEIDIARGSGEYINAYALLSGCNKDIRKSFSGILQKNYSKIYVDFNKNDPLKIYESIERIISSDQKIRDNCKT